MNHRQISSGEGIQDVGRETLPIFRNGTRAWHMYRLLLAGGKRCLTGSATNRLAGSWVGVGGEDGWFGRVIRWRLGVPDDVWLPFLPFSPCQATHLGNCFNFQDACSKKSLAMTGLAGGPGRARACR